MRPHTPAPVAVAAPRPGRRAVAVILVAAFAVVVLLAGFARPAAAQPASPSDGLGAPDATVVSSVLPDHVDPGGVDRRAVGDAERAATLGQESTTSLTRVPLEATPVTESGAERNSAGLWVFIGTVTIITAGAIGLFLKYRNHPRTNA